MWCDGQVGLLSLFAGKCVHTCQDSSFLGWSNYLGIAYSSPIDILIIKAPRYCRCTPDSLKGGERKLLGAPLVTYLGEDAQTGADIDIAVSRLLSPLRRKTYPSSSNVHSGKENGSVSEATDNPTNSCNTQSGSGNQSTDGTELEEMSRWELSFQLSITDERGLSCKPIEKDSLIRPGQFIRVMLDWTDKEHELYDASYLRDLPEVHKNGFTAKKTRPEAITLFSCLEAFLKEEPLGPQDMW